MRQIVMTSIAALGLFAGAFAISHPATERFIPIGQSPGVSSVKSYVGAIESVRSTASGFTMSVGDGEKPIQVTENTKIYLDTGPGESNKIGTEQDCRVGHIVEVYLRGDGTANWIKIRVP